MRSDRDRLLDIVEAIDKIERYTARGKDAFKSDEFLQVWIIHHLQTVGEAASKLDPDFRQHHSTIPWARIIAMRNILVHAYFSVDLDEVWTTAEQDIPMLRNQILVILDELNRGQEEEPIEG